MKKRAVLIACGMAVAVLSVSGVARSGIPGDIPQEYINSGDLDLVRGNWGRTVTPGRDGDWTGDGFVGMDDLDWVRAQWGEVAAAGGVQWWEEPVNSSHLDIVRAAWGYTVTPGEDGDWSGDGFVGLDDLDWVRARWGDVAAAGDDDLSDDFGTIDEDIINSGDLDLVRGNWGLQVEPGIFKGDWNEDGVVNSTDLDFVRAHWGEDAWQLLPGGVNAVPEPSVLAALCAALGLLAIRRR